jgi:hypothetical protein
MYIRKFIVVVLFFMAMLSFSNEAFAEANMDATTTAVGETGDLTFIIPAESLSKTKEIHIEFEGDFNLKDTIIKGGFFSDNLGSTMVRELEFSSNNQSSLNIDTDILSVLKTENASELRLNLEKVVNPTSAGTYPIRITFTDSDGVNLAEESFELIVENESEERSIERIEIQSDASEVTVDSLVELKAEAITSNNERIDVTSDSRFTVNGENLAAIEDGNILKAIAEGEVEIEASFDGHTAVIPLLIVNSNEGNTITSENEDRTRESTNRNDEQRPSSEDAEPSSKTDEAEVAYSDLPTPKVPDTGDGSAAASTDKPIKLLSTVILGSFIVFLLRSNLRKS